MKTPIDSAAAGAGATAALLNGGGQISSVGLWKITLSGGTVIRWHDGAGNPMLAADGSYPFTAAGGQSTAANGTYLKGPPISRGRNSTKLGLQVATLTAQFLAGATDLINGTALLPFAMARGFDGANLVLYKGFMPTLQSAITGVVVSFAGLITSIGPIDRTGFAMNVSASTVLLNQNMGPDVFQASCLNVHYDADCGLTPTLGVNLFNGVVAAGSPAVTAFGSNLANADHFFDKGKVTFTSGANAGLSRTAQSFVNAGGAIVLAYGFPTAPAPGDTFQALRGCLLNTADCTAQANLIHFRGQPFIPPAVAGVVG